MLRRLLFVVPACLGALLVFNSSSTHAQERRVKPAQKSARVVERGQNHSRWETVSDVVDPFSGETIQQTNSYPKFLIGEGESTYFDVFLPIFTLLKVVTRL